MTCQACPDPRGGGNESVRVDRLSVFVLFVGALVFAVDLLDSFLQGLSCTGSSHRLTARSGIQRSRVCACPARHSTLGSSAGVRPAWTSFKRRVPSYTACSVLS